MPEPKSTAFAPEPTEWVTLIPDVYNADTLGIRPDLIGRPPETWAELLTPEFKGEASILNIPSIASWTPRSVRDGGSYVDGMGAISCWNAVMDEDAYMIGKWSEFVAA